jgi:prepilin-type N-terminal cleavage/methylation domain-containing protein
MRHPYGSTPPPSGEAPPKGKKPGFTLIELLISMTLFGIVMAATVGLLMSQRSLYDIQADRMAVQRSIRASVDLMTGELRSVPPGGVLVARPDSITVHYPIRWGLVCGLAIDASGAEMFLRAAEDALFEYQVQSGYGIKEPDADWAFFEEADPLWGDTLYAESLFLCKEGAGAKFQAATTYNKDGTVNVYADTATADYVRFNNFTGTTGAAPLVASQFIVYTDITYRFGPSAFEPGTWALYRSMPGAVQELTGLFADDAGFEYVMKNGSRTNIGTGQLDEIAAVVIKARGYKEVNTSGIQRSLEYNAEVTVPLRNMEDN